MKNLYNYINEHFFHTLLSVLGLIIGISLLVGAMALTDQVEIIALKKVSQAGNLESVIVRSNTHQEVDGVRLRKDNIKVMDYSLLKKLESYITVNGTKTYIESDYPGKFRIKDFTGNGIGLLSYVNETELKDATIVSGRWLNKDDLYSKKDVAVITTELSYDIAGDSTGMIVGREVSFLDEKYEIVGLISTKEPVDRVFVPFTLLGQNQLKGKTPITNLMAPSMEEVSEVRTQVSEFLLGEFGEKQSHFIVVNEDRVQLMKELFFLGKLGLGFIITTVILMGGIGLTNILLLAHLGNPVMPMTDLNYRYFFTRSLIITSCASVIGLIFGLVGGWRLTPIINFTTNSNMKADVSLPVFVSVIAVTLIVALLFSIYPAMAVRKATKSVDQVI